MLKNITFLFLPFLLVSSCNNKSDKLFTLMDEGSTGVEFRNMLLENDEFNVLNYSYFYNGAGVAIGDVNKDGLQDVLFTGNMVKNRLFLNKGDFKFEDITQKSGVADMEGWCTGATMVDINEDGNIDIYISRSADINPARRKNLLFINNGDLTFTEKAEEFGLADEGYSTQASFFDYDKDGDLDCFIINHSLQKYSSGVQDNPELRQKKDPDFASKLYRNDNNRFTNVSDEAGIFSNVLTFGLGLSVADYNNDGWSDIFVSNDFNEPDYLFINNQDGTFKEQLSECMDQTSLFSMGADAADFNNDRLVDLITLDMMAEDNKTQKMHSGAENFDKFQYLFSQGFYYQYSRNMLQKNNGDGSFSEVGQLAGVSNTDWSWAALFGDYDNDGNKDLFITNGYVKDYTDMDFVKYSVDLAVRSRNNEAVDATQEYISKMPTIEVPNYIYQNLGDGRFSKKTNEWGLDQKVVSAGAAYADLDNDGDLDLVVNNNNAYAGIYRNNNEKNKDRNYLKIKLQGDAKNTMGIGAKVSVYCKNNVYYQEQMPVRGFQSSVDPILNFGMGANNVADSIVIIWPNDKMQKLVQVKANQTLVVKSGDAAMNWGPDTVSVKPFFTTTSSLQFTHKENDFNDFTVQSLLINYLSRQGPCMAKADVDKDGREDIFIGGAKGQPGQLFIQLPDGKFTQKRQTDISKDSVSEDVAAEFFDAEGDGDVDLYVGSGGYDFAPNDPALQDRLYINDGKGHFTKNVAALPPMLFSTGCVKSADINGDGAMDLFVGNRLVPRNYPFSAESVFLLNDGKGRFRDASAAVAPGLSKLGMVTDAVWMDVNGDKSSDLVVAGEWMPIRVLLNQKGKLVDASANYIKFASTGWWNRILAEDFDGDGDKDLVIGNLGENAQFRASEKEPITLHYKDFDGNGSVDPIFCYYIGGVSYPAASRDDLTDQLPGLKKKFLEYHTYATATMSDLFSKDQLKEAQVHKAEMLSTVYLENNGTAGFELKALPMEAQYAPVYALAAVDANSDGHKDLILAGNNSWTRIKFGRYTANHGTLLLGDGKGHFSCSPQRQCGLKIRGDVRSLQAVAAGKQTRLLFGINNAPVTSVQLQ